MVEVALRLDRPAREYESALDEMIQLGAYDDDGDPLVSAGNIDLLEELWRALRSAS